MKRAVLIVWLIAGILPASWGSQSVGQAFPPAGGEAFQLREIGVGTAVVGSRPGTGKFPKPADTNVCPAAEVGAAASPITSDWQPLWNGRSLAGWHTIGKGEWKIENGVLIGRMSRWQWRYGHLVSDAEYEDFTLRLQFKAVAGNSGVYFRAEKAGSSGISGVQAEIDPAKDTGGLFESHGRGWLMKPAKSAFRPGEWNTLTISTQGPEVVIELNGQQTVKYQDQEGRRKGHVALQLHARQSVEVHFRKIEICERKR